METKNKPGKKGKIVPFKKRGPLAVVDFDGMHVRVVQVTPNGETGRRRMRDPEVCRRAFRVGRAGYAMEAAAAEFKAVAIAPDT